MTIRSLALAAVSVAALCGAPALAQEHAEFTVNNESSSTLTEINISEPGAEEWEANILDEEVGPGDSVTISVDPESCNWDIQAVYDDGDTQQDDDIDLCALDGEEFTIVDEDDDGEEGDEEEGDEEEE